MANYLVTGGGGFIGSHLARHLADAGESVRVLDNFSTGSRENLKGCEGKIDLVEGDMCDMDAARRAVADMDYVLHEAAIPSVVRSVDDPPGTTANNVMGTVNLLTAAQRAKVRRFVYAASSSAYGDQPVEVKVETLSNNPLSPYAAAKLTGEFLCQAFYRSFGLETVSLRYFNVFGPRQDPASPYSAVIPLFICALLEGRRPKIYGDGLQSRDFTYVDNVVLGNVLAATSKTGAGQTINVACGESYTLLDLLDRLSGILGVASQPEFLPPRPGDVRHSKASIEKAGALLGYRVKVSFDEGLRRTLEYYRSQRK
ncbi:MAG: SDR family oxidoreductase [Candidatus Sumerlaeota bacterium]|nr:SDR family oxidoreductase [Candidatus Sumerlaeota bacterium]